MNILNLLAPKTSAPVVTTAKNDQLPATPRVRPAASTSKPYRPVPILPPRRPDASKTLSDLLNRPVEHRMAGWTREEDREVDEEVYILSEPNRIDMPKYLEHLKAKAKHHNSSDESEGNISIDDSSRECSAEGEAIVSALVGSSTCFNQIQMDHLASDDEGDSDGEDKRGTLAVSDGDRISNVGAGLGWENELVVEQESIVEEVGEESFEALLRNADSPDGMRMISETEYMRLKTIEADHATIVNELNQANLTIDRIEAKCELLEEERAAQKQIQRLPRGSSIALSDDGRDRGDIMRDDGSIDGDQSGDDAKLMGNGEIDDAADLDVQSVVDGPEHAVAPPLDDTEIIQSFLDAADISLQDWNAFERHSIFDANQLVELKARTVKNYRGRMQSSWTTKSATIGMRSRQKFYRDYDIESKEWRALTDAEWKRLRHDMGRVIDLPVSIGNQLIEMQYPGLRACEEGSWLCNALRDDVRARMGRADKNLI